MRANKPPARGARVIILARFSSDLQNPLSADDQIQRCLEECERNGWIVVETHKDEAKSGRSVIKRSGYIATMAAAIAGRCDLIMVTALDRLGRNARELNDARYRLSDHHVQIYTLDRGNLSGFEFALRAEIAQDEAERIGQRVKDGQRAASARGKVMGDAAYGYRLVDTGVINPKTKKMQRRIEKDPVTSKVVLRIHQDYDAGVSPYAIAAALTRDGIETPEGGTDWSPSTILGAKERQSGILGNPLVAGLEIFGKTYLRHDPRTGKTTKHPSSEEDWVITEQPGLQITPRDLWERNRARLKSRRHDLPGRARSADYLLSGKIKCSICGRSYMMKTATKLGCHGRTLHICKNARRVERTAVERVVLDGLRDRLACEDVMAWFLPEYLAETQRARSEADDRRSHATQRLEVIEREITALVRQARAGAEGYAARIINDELAKHGAERERLSHDLKAAPPPMPLPSTASEGAQRLRRMVENLQVELVGPERDARRASDLIREMITEVSITPLLIDGRTDPRATGPVRVTVTGQITTLLNAALLDRRVPQDLSTKDMQDSSAALFTFYGDVMEEVSAVNEGGAGRRRRDCAPTGRPRLPRFGACYDRGDRKRRAPTIDASAGRLPAAPPDGRILP